MVPLPSFDHQQVSAAVFRQLDEALDDCPRCQAVFATDVEFSPTNDAYVPIADFRAVAA
jgi:hypothetical protein